MGFESIVLSDRLVMRFGIKPPLVIGLTFFAIGLLWFTQAPVDGDFVADVLPGMILMGIGGGITFNPLLLAAMGDVEADRGRARIGDRQHRVHDGRRARPRRARERGRLTHGQLPQWRRRALEALTGGYHVAFFVAAAFAALGVAPVVLPRPPPPGGPARARPGRHGAEGRGDGAFDGARGAPARGGGGAPGVGRGVVWGVGELVCGRPTRSCGGHRSAAVWRGHCFLLGALSLALPHHRGSRWGGAAAKRRLARRGHPPPRDLCPVRVVRLSRAGKIDVPV